MIPVDELVESEDFRPVPFDGEEDEDAPFVVGSRDRCRSS